MNHEQEQACDCTQEHAQDQQGGCACGHEHAQVSLKPYLIRLVAALVITVIFSFVTVPWGVSFGAFLAAYLLAGFDVLKAALSNIARGKVFDENFLMTVASIGAFVIGDMPEAVAVMIFYGVGELLQESAVVRSRKNIAKLMDIRPDAATLLTAQGEIRVKPEEVLVGDVILCKPGERIPLDGTVRGGEAFLDTKALTGESVPRKVRAGEDVLSGMVNQDGLLEIVVTKPFGESTVSKILELVQNASTRKAKSEQFITKFARYYTPVVVFVALGIAVLPPLLGAGAFPEWIYKALSFLIISCPCALVISIPISFFGGLGGAARHGLLIKGGNYLEALNQVKTVVMDKTGTLTEGVFSIVQIAPASGFSETTLLELAAVAEAHSSHPIAKSILEAYGSQPPQPPDVHEAAGYGVTVRSERGVICAGNAKLMAQQGIGGLPVFAKTTVHVSLDGKYCGYLLIADRIKPDAKQAIAQMRDLGVEHIVMLTGDSEQIAQEVAQELGIEEFRAGLLPQDKLTALEELNYEGGTAFVGDGINDAPVLVRADVGVAMGGVGSDAAIEAADMVVMTDEVRKIPLALRIAKKTRSIVTQNIVFALGVKAAVMVLALLGITSIWFAIFADVGVALLALLNATRAMRIRE